MLHATIIYATINVVMSVEDPCRKGLSFMGERNINLNLTKHELEILVRSVGFSVEATSTTLQQYLEGGYNKENNEIAIPAFPYEEWRDYKFLHEYLKNENYKNN